MFFYIVFRPVRFAGAVVLQDFEKGPYFFFELFFGIKTTSELTERRNILVERASSTDS